MPNRLPGKVGLGEVILGEVSRDKIDLGEASLGEVDLGEQRKRILPHSDVRWMPFRHSLGSE